MTVFMEKNRIQLNINQMTVFMEKNRIQLNINQMTAFMEKKRNIIKYQPDEAVYGK